MKDISKKYLMIDTLVFIIFPFILDLAVESFCHKSFFAAVDAIAASPAVYICNCFIISATLSVGVFFRRYKYFWVELLSIIWLLLGLANFLLLSNRTFPLTPHDLTLPDLLPGMMKRYLHPAVSAVVCFAVVVLIIAAVVLFVRAPRLSVRYSIRRQAVFYAIVLALTLGSVRLAIWGGTLETHFYQLDKAFLDNGFAYSFISGITDNGVGKVDGYSKELMEEISDGLISDEGEADTPSIIFLQLESFFDVKAMRDLQYSSDPTPNLTRLTAENGSGLFTVPVIGAGTINTEFEVATGMRAGDFGAGEYPYKTVVADGACESTANNLRKYGYTSHFIHNYRGTFYGRNKVYANLGYDYFTALEFMSGYDSTPNGWPKDFILTKYINESLDSTDGPDLVTAISVQPHGKYGGQTDYERHVTVSGCDDAVLLDSYDYYVNQVYETDMFLGELIESLSRRDEDIILVAYGDHLPALEITDDDVTDRSIYQTDYFIWNNMGLTFEDEDICAYQLSAKVLEKLGIREGVINSCHQSFKGQDNYLFNLQALEYDTLYGKRYVYGGESPYAPTHMKKNNRTLKLTEILPKEGEENVFVVKGSGFTEVTYVRANHMLVSTKYIDGETLEFKWSGYESGLPVSLWEKGIGESQTINAP